MASAASSSVPTVGNKEGTYLLDAVEALLKDDGFKLGTTRMNKALEAAGKFKQWIPQNKNAVLFFEGEILKHWKRCTEEGVCGDKRDSCYTKFHKLRSSSAFKNLWKIFLAPVHTEMAEDPIFYQYLTRILFNNFIKLNFPIPPPADTTTRTTSSITFEDSNALRYIAGHVCFKLYKKLMASSNPKKDDLIMGIVDMIDEGKEDADDPSASWVNLIDRGGLVHVHNKVFVLFTRMEEIVRQHMSLRKGIEVNEIDKDKITEDLLKSDGVLCIWSEIGVELEEEDKTTLLQMIIKLYVTIRGFSFASSIVEIYKQSSKKNLKGSRSLRTKLNAKSEKVSDKKQ